MLIVECMLLAFDVYCVSWTILHSRPMYVACVLHRAAVGRKPQQETDSSQIRSPRGGTRAKQAATNSPIDASKHMCNGQLSALGKRKQSEVALVERSPKGASPAGKRKKAVPLSPPRQAAESSRSRRSECSHAKDMHGLSPDKVKARSKGTATSNKSKKSPGRTKLKLGRKSTKC